MAYGPSDYHDPADDPTNNPPPPDPTTAPPGSTPPPPTTGGYSGPKNAAAMVNYWRQNHPASTQDIAGLIKFLNENGVAASNATHAGGQLSDDKISIGGQIYDLGSSLGSPQGVWFDNFDPMGDGGGGNDFAVDPSYLAPWTGTFEAPEDSTLPTFEGPGAFELPSMEDMLKDPSYLFREGRIRDSVENSASAAGTLNSSGTLDRVMGSVGDFASQEYGNIFNRKANIWSQDWGHALDTYGARTGRANTSYSRALSLYDRAKAQFESNQDRPWQKLREAAEIGRGALD